MFLFCFFMAISSFHKLIDHFIWGCGS